MAKPSDGNTAFLITAISDSVHVTLRNYATNTVYGPRKHQAETILSGFTATTLQSFAFY
ncbi:hypothetical protein HDU82_006918 [Entophlyctis luteolus]|nr:hypothetical protein HDU82_006918 [Entophlyctis luteolus]